MMVGVRSTHLALAISTVVTAVSNPLAPLYLESARRQESGWPQSVADSVHNSSWPEFAAETERWSSFEAPTFDAVFIPESEDELSAGLKYLTSNNIPFLARSGGHGYSITLRLIQDGVMINMEKFNSSIINDDLTATIGSGVSFNDMVQALSSAERELTVGSCPCVGATGAMLGGGVGRLQGLYGLTSDAVRKLRIALWNGTIIEASEDVNSDLYWGMRGAGQNFGIVIETTYETYPQINDGLNYQADLTFSVDSVGDLIDTVNSMLPLDPALSLIVIGSVDPTTLELVVALNLVYAGPEDEGQKYTQLFTNFSTSLDESILTWANLSTQSAGGFVAANCAEGRREIMYGTATKVLDTPSFIQLYNDFGSFVKTYPAANGSGFIVETFGQQAVNALPDDYDAFPHRGKINNLVEIDIVFVDDSVSAVGDAFAKGWRDHFAQPNISGYDSWIVYQNYGHGDEPPSILYGTEEWRHERLTTLKDQYDPKGVFNAYHAVPSTLASWT